MQGFLCEPTREAFAGAIRTLLDSPLAAAQMGSAARAHVRTHFSRRAMGEGLRRTVAELAASGARKHD
jgi:glycosyltransferase involved in cell wall biosynthesis